MIGCKQVTWLLFFLLICLSKVSLSQQIVQFEGLLPIQGTNLFCKVTGKIGAEPLVIVHGGPGLNHSYLEPYLRPLEKYFTLIYYDQRSSGQSALSVKENMNFETFTADIEEIRKHFKLNKINILGHAWGGLIAANYSLKYQDHTASLIFCNSIPMNRNFDNEMLDRKVVIKKDSAQIVNLTNTKAYQKGDASVIEQLLLLNFKSQFCDTLKWQKLQFNVQTYYAVASLSFQGFTRYLKNYDLFSNLSELTIPVYIIHGKCDQTPIEADEKLHSSILNSQFVEFSSSGHFPFIEENKLFNRKLKRFIEKN